MKTQRNRPKKGLLIIAIVAVVLPLGWFLVNRLEGDAPTVKLNDQLETINKSKEVIGFVEDKANGIRFMRIVLNQGEKETVLMERRQSFWGLFSGGGLRRIPIDLKIIPKDFAYQDGHAQLKIIVDDFAWRRWFHGNRNEKRFDLTIDTIPPRADILSRAHNINQGGAGLVIYKLSESCPESGVMVGQKFYPGYSGYYPDKAIHIAYMALDYSQTRDTEISVIATDFAGNKARSGFPYYLKNKRWKKDTIKLGDRFLNWKVPEFKASIPELEALSPIHTFLEVNREVRKENGEKLKTLPTATRQYWKGAFLRMPNAARKAGYADHRDYQYQGKVVDHQVHLGIDLASVAKSQIPAANNGKVVFKGELGIYGKTVVIDHGFGLQSLYSHLSMIDVSDNQEIAKGDIIGRTGTTGMAGGDHLHFSMLVNGTFVNPVEWWDASWIKNNITDKFDVANSSSVQ